MGAGENKYCGALLNFDLSPNPAFKVIDKLINEEWRTEGIYDTNEYGVANINGFKGDYDLEFSYNGKNYTNSIKLDCHYDCINKITLEYN